MFKFWFILVAIYVATFIFNTGVVTKPVTKNLVNVIAVIATIVLAIVATTRITI